jgi:hypothetical protein
MRGDWLTTVGRRILHSDTFEIIVSPAIADLQFDSWRIGSGYVGVWRAFGGALCRDLGRDLRILCDDAATLTSLIVMQACYYACLLTLMSGLTTSGLAAVRAFERISADAALAFALIIVGLSTVPTLLCFWPARR